MMMSASPTSYILSGGEDLTPVLDAKGARVTVSRTVFGVAYQVAYYRPRIEGLLARIERWRASATGMVHWRSITRDNVISIYGDTAESQVADPADPRRIFEWRVSQTFNDKGDATFFVYAHEDGAGIATAAAPEANRTPQTRAAQTYLRQILYGNRTPYFVDFTAANAPPVPADWMFALSLDYGDHAGAGLDPDGPWPLRIDPFSTYRAGFEVRTYRRVQRLLFFNNFPAEASIGANGLVRSMDMVYSDQLNTPDPQGPIYTFLVSLTQTGYRKDAGGSCVKSLPPLQFAYTSATLDPTIRKIDRDSLVGSLIQKLNHTDVSGMLNASFLKGLAQPYQTPKEYNPNPGKDASLTVTLDPRGVDTAIGGPLPATIGNCSTTSLSPWRCI
jgi:hypothetical protein